MRDDDERDDDEDDYEESSRQRSKQIQIYSLIAIGGVVAFFAVWFLASAIGRNTRHDSAQTTGNPPADPAKPTPPALPPEDMSLKAFVLQKPTTPTAVQVDCKLATYYNYAFAKCADTHYSIDISAAQPRAHVHVYVPKSSEAGQRLYEMLKDGSGHKMTLRIQRVGPDGVILPTKEDGHFALVGIVD